MSSLKTFLACLLLAPLPVSAETDLATTFAACVGRFSAELEHAWLMGDPRSAELEMRRGHFIDLLNATIARDQRRASLNWRIDAKMAHAGLLTQATFSDDVDRAAWAVRRADAEIAYCRSFLLES